LLDILRRFTYNNDVKITDGEMFADDEITLTTKQIKSDTTSAGKGPGRLQILNTSFATNSAIL
jgi:hypothetical protein